MATGSGRFDEMVKEYLLFRGFTSTVRTLETELKADRDRGLRVDKIVEQFLSCINGHDLTQLREHWSYLDQRVFSRLEQTYASSVRKLETSLLKFYVVKAVESNRQDKVNEFFERLALDLQGHSDWRDWFVLPYIKSPQTNPTFALNFNTQWQDTVLLSLHNFLSVVFQSMPVPTLLHYEQDAKTIEKLEDENEMFKSQVKALLKTHDLEAKRDDIRYSKTSSAIPPSVEMMDDFYVISQNSSLPDESQSTHSNKTNLKTVLKELPKRLAPIGMNKKTSASKADASKQKYVDASAKEKKLKPTTSQPIMTVLSYPVDNGEMSQSDQVTAPSIPIKLRSSEENERNRRELLGRDERIAREKPEGSSSVSVIQTAQTPPSYRRVQSAIAGPTESLQEEKGVTAKNSPSRTKRISSESTPPRPSLSDPVPGPRRTSSPLTTADNDPLRDSLSDDNDDITFLLIGQEEFVEHHSTITHCRFSQTGGHIASSDVDGVVKIWAMQPSPTTVATIMSKSAFTALDWASRQDRMILLGNKAGFIKLFDVQEKRTIYESQSDPAFPRIVSINSSPQGLKFVCSAAGRAQQNLIGFLSMWDIKSMQVERKLPLTSSGVAINCTSFNHNGHLLVAGGTDGFIRMFDIQRHECIASWQAHSDEVLSVQFSFDENSLFSLGTDNKFHQWSVHRMGTKMADLQLHKNAVGPFTTQGYGGYKQVHTPRGKVFAFDAEGSYVLTCSPQGGVIYKTNVGSLERTMLLRGHKTPVVSVDWSPSVDTKICLTGAMDGKIHVSTLLSQNS